MLCRQSSVDGTVVKIVLQLQGGLFTVGSGIHGGQAATS